jgi:hypothetical protein
MLSEHLNENLLIIVLTSVCVYMSVCSSGLSVNNIVPLEIYLKNLFQLRPLHQLGVLSRHSECIEPVTGT